MRFEMMLPHQIRAAIEANTPVALAVGVLEYHGEHMAVGMDLLAVTSCLDRARSRHTAALRLRRRFLRGGGAGADRNTTCRRRQDSAYG